MYWEHLPATRQLFKLAQIPLEQLTYTPEGKRVGVTTYKEIRLADGLAMDTAGNILIADHDRGKVEVYSSCGALIKTIRTGTRHAVDVEIGNDGTVLVADHITQRVFMY